MGTAFMLNFLCNYLCAHLCLPCFPYRCNSSRKEQKKKEGKNRGEKEGKVKKGKKSLCKIKWENLYYVMRCMWWMFIRERYVQYIYLCVSTNIIFLYIMGRVFKV